MLSNSDSPGNYYLLTTKLIEVNWHKMTAVKLREIGQFFCSIQLLCNYIAKQNTENKTTSSHNDLDKAQHSHVAKD